MKKIKPISKFAFAIALLVGAGALWAQKEPIEKSKVVYNQTEFKDLGTDEKSKVCWALLWAKGSQGPSELMYLQMFQNFLKTGQIEGVSASEAQVLAQKSVKYGVNEIDLEKKIAQEKQRIEKAIRAWSALVALSRSTKPTDMSVMDWAGKLPTKTAGMTPPKNYINHYESVWGIAKTHQVVDSCIEQWSGWDEELLNKSPQYRLLTNLANAQPTRYKEHRESFEENEKKAKEEVKNESKTDRLYQLEYTLARHFAPHLVRGIQK